MSSRQLRKLQKQQELERAALQVQAEEEEGEPVLAQKPKPSLFANLAVLEDEADGSGVEEGDGYPTDNLSEPEPDPSVSPKKAKQSKKKKKKKKTKSKEISEEKSDTRHDEDEIETALKELKLKDVATGKSAETAVPLNPEYQRICSLLCISTNNLKVANEMRSLFGKDVEDTDDAGGRVGRGTRRRQRNQPQQVDLETALKRHGGKGLPELTLRRNYLIQGKDDWPNSTTGGLIMKIVDDQAPDGTIEFTYAHEKTYQDLQQTFHQLVEMGDPQNLIGLLTRNPYHISLLIQVSKIAKDQGDHALSADLLERALFSFGRAATSVFNTKLSQGKARLDFARPENRELWLAGYHYIKALIQKGTYRTAFEWAKSLVSISPEEDPYCMFLMLHTLALRAREPRWLLDLYESAIPTIWQSSTNDRSTARLYFTPSLTLAAVQLKDPVKSREYLVNAMSSLPWLFARLFKDLNLDPPKTIWGTMPRTDAETLFTELYVSQTKELWNSPEVTALLMEIAHTITKPDIDALPLLDNGAMTLDIVRHVYLDNKPNIMALVPSALLHRNNNSDSDPLPPDHNIFSYPAQQHAIQGSDRGAGYGVDDFNNPMAALARILGGLQLPGLGTPDAVANALQQELAATARAQDDGSGSGSGSGSDEAEYERDNEPTPGFTRRLLSIFTAGGWSGTRRENVDDGDDDENGTDTDSEIPVRISTREAGTGMQAMVESDDDDLPFGITAINEEPSDADERRQINTIVEEEMRGRRERAQNATNEGSNEDLPPLA